MSSLSVISDGGHGGRDSGAVNGKVYEKNIALKIDKYIYDGLLRCNIKAMRTRTGDMTLDPVPRANKVKNSGMKICISSHLNSALNKSARGVEIFVSRYSDKTLAREILRVMESKGVDVSRGVKTRLTKNGNDFYYMHRNTGSVETLIIENLFLSNEVDKKFLVKDKNILMLAECMVNGICNKYKIKYIPLNNSPIKKGYSLQVGYYENRDNAEKRKKGIVRKRNTFNN